MSRPKKIIEKGSRFSKQYFVIKKNILAFIRWLDHKLLNSTKKCMQIIYSVQKSTAQFEKQINEMIIRGDK